MAIFHSYVKLPEGVPVIGWDKGCYTSRAMNHLEIGMRIQCDIISTIICLLAKLVKLKAIKARLGCASQIVNGL